MTPNVHCKLLSEDQIGHWINLINHRIILCCFVSNYKLLIQYKKLESFHDQLMNDQLMNNHDTLQEKGLSFDMWNVV